jgi:hypothetical protein
MLLKETCGSGVVSADITIIVVSLYLTGGLGTFEWMNQI